MEIFSDQHKLIKSLIESADVTRLKQVLKDDPSLANEGLPFDETNTITAHPLHRICDAVFAKKITGEQAVQIAKVFLEAGADVNAAPLKNNADTPLTAACSLHADKVALLYIDQGADIHHPGCHGGTALHWACWCGRDVVVKKLLEKGAQINKLCEDFKSTPLFWAVHGLRFGGKENQHHQSECVKLLLDAGADKNIPNFEGYKPIEVLKEEDVESKRLLAD